MKKIFNKKLIAILAVLVLVVCTTGCSFDISSILGGNTAESLEQSNLAVVISPTANQPAPNLELAEDQIFSSCRSYGYKCVVVDDGDPFMGLTGDLMGTENKNLSDNNKQRDAEAYTDAFISDGSQLVAEAPEKDTAKAIRLAANSLNGLLGDNKIILIDNGISTSGRIAFSTFQNMDVNTILENLNESDFPDLTGITDVVWFEMGEVAGQQEELSNEDLQALQDFWRGYLEKCGAESVTFDTSVSVKSEEEQASNLPSVTPVEVTPETTAVPNFDATAEAVESASSTEEADAIMSESLAIGLKLDGKSIAFKADSTDLVDPTAAAETLAPITDYLSRTTDCIVLLGETATDGTQEECVNFSLRRAEAIKQLILEGTTISDSQILVVGLGYQHEFHLSDLNADGSLNEDIAPQNRAVLIFSSEADAVSDYVT